MKKKIIIFIIIVLMLTLTFSIHAESKFEFSEIKFKETNSDDMFKILGEIKNNTDTDYDTVYFELVAFNDGELVDIETIIIQDIYANTEKYFVAYLYDLSPDEFNDYELRVKDLYKFE